MTSPARRREVVNRVIKVMGISERHAYRAFEQPRSGQRYAAQTSVQEELSGDSELTVRFGRHAQQQDGMGLVGQCAAEKAERAIREFDETVIVC